MTYSTLEITDKNEWSALPHSFWQQTWEFGEVQKASDRKILRLVLRGGDTNEVVAYVQAVAYDIFRGKTIVYCPYGPTWLQGPNADAWSVLKQELKKFGKTYNAFAVRMEDGAKEDAGAKAVGFRQVSARMYHASFHAPRGEMLLNITQPLEQLAESFHKKTAYNMRKASKNGLFTKIYSGSEMLTQLELFVRLNKANMRGHGTTTHTDAYFKTLFETLAQNENNFVIVTYSGLEEPQAINVFTVWGKGAQKKTHCPYGASSPEGKKSGAYYFIKQEAIKHLQKLEVTEFNWGGISVGLHDDSLKGLNQFKEGFGGTPYTHGQFYDLPLNFWYWLYVVKKLIT